MLLENTIHLGDCLELMKELPDKSVDLILCDLPYGVTSRNAWDSIIPLEALWRAYNRIAKDNAAIVLTAIQPFTSHLVLSNETAFKYEWIWEKSTATNFLNAKKQPLRNHESVLVFYRKQVNYVPQKTHGHVRKVSTAEHKRDSINTPNYGVHGLTAYDSTERYPKSVVKFPNDKQKSAIHPTQKPVALFEYLIKTYTNPGDLVLDNCAGSGTTAVACKATGRRFICIEKDPVYWQKAVDRVSSLGS